MSEGPNADVAAPASPAVPRPPGAPPEPQVAGSPGAGSLFTYRPNGLWWAKRGAGVRRPRRWTWRGGGDRLHAAGTQTAEAPVNHTQAPKAEEDPLAALDEYEIRHLTEHLESTGDAHTLDAILRLEWRERSAVKPSRRGLSRRGTPPGERVRSHPAWFDAKNRHNSAEDFVEDVRRTWRLAAQTNETNETKETNEADQGSGKAIAALGLEARYALILASVNSFGAAIPLALVVALVRGGAWDVRQAIGYARRIPEPDRRLTALSELLSLLPDPLRTDIATEAFGTALRIQAEQSHRQPTVPDALAACLPEDLVRQALEEMTSLRGTLLRRLVELGFLDDAVRLARQNWDDQAALVPYLREEQVRRWLAEKTGGYGPRAELGVRLAALGYPDEALKLARTFKCPTGSSLTSSGISRHRRWKRHTLWRLSYCSRTTWCSSCRRWRRRHPRRIGPGSLTPR